MTIKIRSADLVNDRSEVLTLFSHYLNPDYDARRFEWLYHANPAGMGRLWLAVEGSTGRIVGAAGAFPRAMSRDGQAMPAWVLGDFCIDPSHRTLGPALLLQRACFDELAVDRVPFCYDFPSGSMEGVYRRLGVGLGSRSLIRLARPLRTGRKLAARWGSSVVVRAFARTSDLALARAARMAPAGGALEVEIQAGPCGAEFTALAGLASAAYGLCTERSARYLRWRYQENPLQQHEILCVRQAGALVGYTVLAHGTDATTAVDIFCIPDPYYVRTLVRGAVARAWLLGSATVSVALPSSHPWVALCRRLGFRPREASVVVPYAPPGSYLDSRAIVDSPWFLTLGDRDA